MTHIESYMISHNFPEKFTFILATHLLSHIVHFIIRSAAVVKENFTKLSNIQYIELKIMCV